MKARWVQKRSSPQFKDQKKVFAAIWGGFSPQIRLNTKNKGLYRDVVKVWALHMHQADVEFPPKEVLRSDSGPRF